MLECWRGALKMKTRQQSDTRCKIRQIQALKSLKRVLKQEQGATLVEVVLAMAIFCLLLTTLLAFYHSNLQSWKRSLITIDVQQNARIAMWKITRKLRYAHTLDFQNEAVLPLYNPEDEERHGATSLHFTGLNEKKILTTYVLSFDKNNKSVSLKSGLGTRNEIAYHVAGLDFFRYVPREVLPAKDAPGESPIDRKSVV